MRLAFALAAFSLAPTPALACLSAPPGTVEPPPPSVEQRAAAIARDSAAIVYGVLTRSIESGRDGELRIIHVYKGDLRAGMRVAIRASWGFDPPMCAGLLGGPPPVPKGAYGVFAWSGEPAFNAVSDERLAAMFKLRLIVSAKGG